MNTMNKDSKIWTIVSWIFGSAVLANGVLNLFWGNDLGLGLIFILLSFVYFPPINDLIKNGIGLSIHYIVKIVLGIMLIGITLTVGALAEGYLSSGYNNELNASIPFDKDQWNQKKDMDYIYRDKMLNDLIENVRLKGLNQAEIIALLGEPQRTDNGHLFYPISSKHIGLWTFHAKTLVIKLDENGLVEWRKIHE